MSGITEGLVYALVATTVLAIFALRSMNARIKRLEALVPDDED
jgi:hypothetical protein